MLAFTVLQIFHLFKESCFFTTIHKLIVPQQVIMFSNMITNIVYFIGYSLTLRRSCSVEQVGKEQALGQAGQAVGWSQETFWSQRQFESASSALCRSVKVCAHFMNRVYVSYSICQFHWFYFLKDSFDMDHFQVFIEFLTKLLLFYVLRRALAP